MNNYEGDYENVSGGGGDEKLGRNAAAAVPGKHRRLYERSFSPPRSSNSSGYGTGSSSKSFADPRFPANSEVCMRKLLLTPSKYLCWQMHIGKQP